MDKRIQGGVRMVQWFLTVIMAVLSVILLSGKGAFLIAGYNTASPAQRAKFDEKKICRVTGGGIGVVAILIGIQAYLGDGAPDWFYTVYKIGLISSILLIIVLNNTICRVKNPPVIEESEEEIRRQKSYQKKIWIFTAVILAAVAVFLTTGNISVETEKKDIEIIGSYWTDYTIAIDCIQSITYRDDLKIGSREGGVGSFRLQEGDFKNREFGYYTLYAYTSCKEYVVLETDRRTVVINQKTPKDTKKLYQKLQQVIE